jgi:hypothetical protein
MIDINSPYKGNVDGKFITYDFEKNKALVMKAYPESGFDLPKEVLLKLATWPEDLTCIQK